ncbi:hypothetical protein L914_05987, partial [Phytophthora nicotianae]
MNIKGLFAFALVALVADFSKKLLDAVNAKRAEKGLKA